MKNNLIRGIRKASDFLMALQLTGAFKRDALPNLQARLPAIVIGGGLTAIDTATELMAYYPLQVEKTLAAVRGARGASSAKRACARSTTPRSWNCSTSTARTAAPSATSGRARRAPATHRISSTWCARGAASRIAYRKRMVDSPAYRLNHEEVIKALEEGIAFVENLNPVEAVPDERGALSAMIFRREGQVGQVGRVGQVGSRTLTLPARTVLVAAGTTPNITYEKEAPDTFQLDAKKKFFQPHRAARNGDGEFHVVPDADGFFTSYDSRGRFVSYYGDNHPRYAGNVVKAMASAKDGFPQSRRAVRRRDLAALDRERAGRARRGSGASLVAALDGDFTATRRRRRPADADHRRSDRARRRRRRGISIRGSSTGCRTSRRVAPTSERRASAADGRHRADRRVGRQGEGAAVAHRARARCVEPAGRVPAARASRWS